MMRPDPSLIPDHWSADQALAVFDLFKDITDLIWERYNVQLIDLLSAEHFIERFDTDATNADNEDPLDNLDDADPF